MSPTDATLIQRWKARGDACAFQVLLERHSAMVYRTCLRMLGNREDAEEVTQDCFLRLAQSAAGTGAPVGAWLHRVATNRSLDVLRTRKRRLAREECATLDTQRTHAEFIAWDDFRQHVDEAMAQLPDDLREVIVARFLEGRTQGDIGRELGITRQAVAQRADRGIEQLRKLLEHRGVSLGVGALATGLAGLSAEAAALSSALQASLGRLSMAGPGHITTTFSGTGASAWIAGGIVMKKTLAAAVAVIALGLAAFWYARTLAPARESADPSALVAAKATESNAGDTQAVRGGAPSPPVEAVDRERASAEPGADPAPVEPAYVSGHVRDEAGDPVPNATMCLMVLDLDLPGQNVIQLVENLFVTEGRTLSARTNQEGFYEFAEIAHRGKGWVTARVDGFVAMDDATGVPRQLTIEPGTRIEGADFVLRPGVRVKGRVFSAGRQPVPSARVLCLNVEVADVATNTAGEFELDVIDPSRPLDFAVSAEGFPTQTVENTAPAPDGFFEILLHGFGGIAGTVTEAGGGAATGFEVVAEPVDYAGPIAADATADDGTYQIAGLAAAAYRVSVRAAGGKALSRPEALPPLRDGETREWNHTIKAPAIAEGTVRAAGTGKPAARVGVAWMEDGNAISAAETDGEGRYRLELFGTGDSVILQPLHKPATGPLDLGELTRFARKINTTPGETVEADLELPGTSMMYVRFVSPESGLVVDAEVEWHTWNAADVTLRTDYKTTDAPPADAEGWYAIECPAGSGCMAVLRSGEGQHWLQAQSQQFAPDGIGDSYREEVPVYVSASIQGKFVDPEGRGLHFDRVGFHITDENGEEQYVFPESDKDGDFAEDLRAANGVRMELYGMEDWTWSLEGPLDLPPGEQVELGEIQLRAVE